MWGLLKDCHPQEFAALGLVRTWSPAIRQNVPTSSWGQWLLLLAVTLQIPGQGLAQQPQFSNEYKKVINFQCVQLFHCKNGSDNFQDLYKLELKRKSVNNLLSDSDTC